MEEELKYKKILFVFVLGLIVLALFFTASRGGILSSFVALTVFVLLVRGRRAEFLVLIGGCWLVLGIYGWMIGFEEIWVRFDRIVQGASGRFQIWADTWRMVLDHWQTGIGYEGFSTVGRLYNTYLPESKFYYHAHNDYLELLAELGPPMAGLLFVTAWGYWLKTAWRTLKLGWMPQETGNMEHEGSAQRTKRGISRRNKRRTRDLAKWEVDQCFAAGALAGCAAFLCHSVVEFNWQIPANQFYFVLMMVLAGRFASANEEKRQS